MRRRSDEFKGTSPEMDGQNLVGACMRNRKRSEGRMK